MLPSGKQDRKERPVFSGVFKYFPDALAEVANVSHVGNQQHNPGQPMAWIRHKSTDHGDCVARHLLEAGTIDSDGLRHTAKVAWRALALLQVEIENTGKTPPVEEEIKAKMEAAREPEVAEPTIPGAHSFCSTYYISGPMRNYPEFNFPAFDDAKAFLIAQGLNVISPADMDREHDEDPATAGGMPPYIYAQRDTQALIRLAEDNEKFGLQNGIYMLRGWKKSKGATAEHALAQWLGLEIIYQETV
jgi:hypothetical protein